MVYDITWHDDETMQKVYKAMTDAGIDDKRGVDAVVRMGNAGILFRETSVGRTVSFGEGPSELDLRQRTEQLNETLGPDIKSYRITEDPPAEISEEAMRDFWQRDRIPEETLKKIQEEYYRPPSNEPRLRFNPDENPFKKLEHEERKDDTALD